MHIALLVAWPRLLFLVKVMRVMGKRKHELARGMERGSVSYGRDGSSMLKFWSYSVTSIDG